MSRKDRRQQLRRIRAFDKENLFRLKVSTKVPAIHADSHGVAFTPDHNDRRSQKSTLLIGRNDQRVKAFENCFPLRVTNFYQFVEVRQRKRAKEQIVKPTS